MTPDHLNALFELVGAGFLMLNVRRLLQDREVKGVSAWPAVFWSVWGFWNLYFYPAVGQFWSFAAGLLVAAANATWLSLALYLKVKR